jgi:hypothetical protein
MELRSQRLDHYHPIGVGCQASTRSTPDTMPAVELDIERVKDVAAGADGDLDAVVEGRSPLVVNGRLGRHLIELERDLRQVVKLWNGGSLDLSFEATFQDAVEQRIDVRLLGEVDEGLGFIRSLHVLKVLHYLLEQREGRQEADLELNRGGRRKFHSPQTAQPFLRKRSDATHLFAVGYAILLWANKVKQNLGELVQLTQGLKPSVSLRFGLAVAPVKMKVLLGRLRLATRPQPAEEGSPSENALHRLVTFLFMLVCRGALCALLRPRLLGYFAVRATALFRGVS